MNKTIELDTVRSLLKEARELEKEITRILKEGEVGNFQKEILKKYLESVDQIIIDLVVREVKLTGQDEADFGEFTLQEIADKFGISRERVRQIVDISLRKLKHPKFKKIFNGVRTKKNKGEVHYDKIW